MHIKYFAFRNGNFSGNSQDRRRARRSQERRWQVEPGRFSEGEDVRIRSAEYGARYNGTKVEILGKDEQAGFWLVKSSRRKSPLSVHDDHLESLGVTAARAA